MWPRVVERPPAAIDPRYCASDVEKLTERVAKIVPGTTRCIGLAFEIAVCGGGGAGEVEIEVVNTHEAERDPYGQFCMTAVLAARDGGVLWRIDGDAQRAKGVPGGEEFNP